MHMTSRNASKIACCGRWAPNRTFNYVLPRFWPRSPTFDTGDAVATLEAFLLCFFHDVLFAPRSYTFRRAFAAYPSKSGTSLCISTCEYVPPWTPVRKTHASEDSPRSPTFLPHVLSRARLCFQRLLHQGNQTVSLFDPLILARLRFSSRLLCRQLRFTCRIAHCGR